MAHWGLYGFADAAAARRRARRRLGDARGAELVEFALILPLLLILIAGIVDFALMFQAYEVVTNAAREGARVRVLPGYTNADAQARVTAYLTAVGLDRCGDHVGHADAHSGGGGGAPATTGLSGERGLRPSDHAARSDPRPHRRIVCEHHHVERRVGHEGRDGRRGS